MTIRLTRPPKRKRPYGELPYHPNDTLPPVGFHHNQVPNLKIWMC